MLKEIFLKKSSTVNNSIITLGDTDDSGKGRHFKSRFIQPGVAGYPGQFGNVLITKESLDKFINTMVGVPVVINHKDITKDNADDERVGVVNSVWYDDKDGWYWCDGIIWNETAQNLITDKKWNVSCSYDVLTANDEGGTENNIKYDMEFLDGVFTHLALVNNPRYERANIVFNSKTVIENYREDQKRNERGQWIKDNTLIQQKKDNLIPIKVDPKDIPQFKSKEELGNWFKNIFEELGSVTITDTGIKIDLYGGNAEREAFKRRLQQEPNKAVAKAFEDVITKSIKIDERKKDDSHKHDQDIYFNKLKLGEDNYDVNLFIDYLEPNREYRYAGHKTTKIDNEISTRDTQVINHIMLTKVDNSIINDVDEDFNPNVKEHEDMNNVDNARGFNGEEGDWITVKGVHVFVKKGQSKEDAVKEFVEKKQGDKAEKKEKRGDLGEDSPRHIYGKRQKDSIPVALKTTYYPGWNKEEVLKEFDSEEAALDYAEERGEAIKRDYENKTKTAQEYGLATWVTPRELEHIKKHGYYPDDEEDGEESKSNYQDVIDKYDKKYDIDKNDKGESWLDRASLAEINTDLKSYKDTLKKYQEEIDRVDKLDEKYKKGIFYKNEVETKYNEYKKAIPELKEQIEYLEAHKAKKQSDKEEKKEETNKYRSKFSDIQNLVGSITPGEQFFDSKIRTAEKRLKDKLEAWEEDYEKETKPAVKEMKKRNIETVKEELKQINKLKADNSKEQDMAIIEELKKLITKVENDKGEDMEDKEIKEVENEKVDKRKLIDEVGGILKGKVDDEIIRTIIGKMEKMSYDDSEESADNKKAKNEKEDDKEVECSKKVKNEDAEDKEKVEEVKEDIKEDVDNKCKNSKDFFNKINEIYNTSVEVKEQGYVSRAEREQAAIDYFK